MLNVIIPKDNLINWKKLNPVLKKLELIVVTFKDGSKAFKVGDGVKYFNELGLINNINDLPNVCYIYNDSKFDIIKIDI